MHVPETTRNSHRHANQTAANAQRPAFVLANRQPPITINEGDAKALSDGSLFMPTSQLLISHTCGVPDKMSKIPFAHGEMAHNGRVGRINTTAALVQTACPQGTCAAVRPSLQQA